jgi:hypothetical protein
MNRIGSLVAASAAAAVLAGTGPAWAAPAVTATPASAPLPCHASMSNNHPKDYTSTYVRVHTVAYAGITTVAHYKTVNRKHTGKAGAKGNATIRYYISGATPGYKVVVSVRVVKGNRSGSCSTWFIPHR